MRPERLFVRLHDRRKPGHVDIDQKADIGLRDRLFRREADKAWARMRDIVGLIGFVDGDAGELRQRVDRFRAMHIAPGIAGDQDRIVGLEKPLGEFGNKLWIGAGARGCGRL